MTTLETTVDPATRQRIADFHLFETALLDDRRLNDWIELLTEDFSYEIPTPYTPDNPNLPPWSDGTYIIHENKPSLKVLWADRFSPHNFEFAWGENPVQRVRRFVTNIQVHAGEKSGEYVVRSNIMLSFARQSDPVALVPAGRVDLVREVDGELKLAQRIVHLDQTLMTITHMRLIF
ncbi:aromatic-ring-hydroxylating dioxygenase subunit beta [Rhodococcus sp. NPDC127530]|uniref:aromatic-ring-hydroxylating dioxygenase subunit beta n=1 Tax=unclassified Rhodococcus (in: high G+C Gram-positive bacteria) TaxID=192944 RepID=UPI003643E61B